MPALDQWERRLKPYFSRPLRIVGEIPLSRDELESITERVRLFIARNGMTKATSLLTEQHPHLLLVFLAAFAAHNTEQSYWVALGERLDISHNNFFSHRWHYFFQREVKRRKMRCFEREDQVNPFVTTIRFHGGIPAYSLPDFFHYLLLPSVERPEFNEIPAQAALQQLLGYTYPIDAPVRNFFQFSAELGEEFFEACRRMARHYRSKNGDLLPAEELGLPEYVVEHFEQYMEREEKGQRKARLRKPVLAADPEGIWLRLPEQEVELRYAGGQMEWQINWLGLAGPVHYPCRLRKRRQDTVVDERVEPLPAAAPYLKAALTYREEGREEVLRRWTIPVVPPASRAPLLAFDEEGRPLPSHSGALPACVLALAYPADAQLRPAGEGRLLDDYGRMEGAWGEWQLQTWDLEGAWGLEVIRSGQVLGGMVPVAGSLPQPELVGPSLSPFGEGPVPLYIGELPDLMIPLRPGSSREEELKHCHLEVNSVWETDPNIQVSVTLNEVAPQLRFDDQSAFLQLKEILGEAPVGTYQLRIHRSGVDTVELRLRCWPKLIPMSLPRKLLPAEQNHKAVHFKLRLQEGAHCEAQAGAGDVHVSEKLGACSITAGPDVQYAHLNLVWVTGQPLTVRVPVSIPIPRLQWAAALSSQHGNFAWTSTMLHKPAAALLESESAAIYLSAPGLHDCLDRLRVVLVEMDRDGERLQSAECKPSVYSDWLRVSLAQFRGTLEHACQQGRFDLVLYPRGDEEKVNIPLLYAPRGFEISAVDLNQQDPTNWKLTWQEEAPLKNRRILLAPAWQPWQEAWEFKVPDEARGELLIEGVSLPEARYHVYFYITPPWEEARTSPPADAKAHLVDLCSPQERLAALDAQPLRSDDETFRVLLEKACIFHDLASIAERDQIISQMAVPYAKLDNLRLLIGLLEWLEYSGINSPYTKFFSNKLYIPARVEDVFRRYHPSDPLLLRYLSYIVRGVHVYGQSALLIAERSEDPAVILACLRNLLEKEEELLFVVLSEMIEAGRLSEEDAVELLSEKTRWAAEQLVTMEPSPPVNRMLTGLLRKMSQEDSLDPFILDLMARVLPFESSPAVVSAYLHTLIENGREDGVRELIRAVEAETLPEEEARQILAANPELSYRALQQIPVFSLVNDWMDFLLESYPLLIGVIRPGSLVQTPLGAGRVERIEDLSGRELPEASLKDLSIRVKLAVGDGLDRYRVWVNTADRTLTHERFAMVCKCNYCSFTHPDRDALKRHYRDCHHTARMNFRQVLGKMPFDPESIRLIV